MKLAPLTLLMVAMLASCGDDGGDGPAMDAAPPVDARFLDDATREACSTDADRCAAQDFERVCDTARSICVECLSAGDCQSNASLGPTCQMSDNTCHCQGDEDCASNEGGGYCQPLVGACGCLTVEDCPTNTECKLLPYLGTGIRRCRPL